MRAAALFFLFLIAPAQAQTNQTSLEIKNHGRNNTMLLGHNLTATTNTIPAKDVSLGNYSVSYGLSDQLMISTSPWMILSYNMPMLNLKLSFDAGEIFNRISIEQMYFKTFEYGLDAFKQESTWTRITALHEFSKEYELNLSLGIQYFWNDQSPFSMRPVPTNGTPFTISASTLQQISFNDHWGTFLEGGVLGLNYPNRYLQFGASGFYRWDSGYVQLGLSKSIPIGNEQITTEQFKPWINSKGEDHRSVFSEWEAPLHPEVQIQFLL